ncbi:hypothetical protein CERSUDRAFT_133533, partial [Gelatoporia subvermispora B]
MPPPRPPKARREPENTTATKGDTDTDGDSDAAQDTPRALGRSHSKKRISDVYAPEMDASFTSDSGRAPLKSVNLNDDTAEKRRRRKSAKLAAPALGDNAEAGPSTEGAAEGGATDGARVAALAKQKQLLSVAQAPMINVPLDVMSSNFEEWMKMATDNKINAANSWNFALIDYFHDMSLLRNNTDNSINFQRASCTLDGCVKIWTSRVDSVGTETGKLLSNLANEGAAVDGDDEGANSDNPDGQDSQGQRKRKTHRPESTLAKSAAQLRSKKLDLEFSVDPLFRKTCADFDEGGAQGLLLNHLSLGSGPEGSLRVIFDASDSMGKGDDEEPLEEPVDEVDLSYLRQQFLPDVVEIDDRAISHSLENFSFLKDTGFVFDESILKRDLRADIDDDDDDDYGVPDHGDFGGADTSFQPSADVAGDGEPPPVEDFFVGDQAVVDDYGGDYGSPEGFNAEDGHENGDGVPHEGPALGPGGFVPFDPRRAPNERDIVMAMTEGDEEGGGMMMDYFDQTFLKNWAGPEHWKLRKVVRRPDAAEASAPKVKRDKKEAFRIDFLTPSEKDIKVIANELFAPATKGAGITLPAQNRNIATRRGAKGRGGKDKEVDKRNDQTLPDDMHFSSRQLVTLFLKPKFSLKMRGQRGRTEPRGDGEIDENYWAQAAADQAAGRGSEEGDETADGGAIPFNTQFFHDDYDDGPGFDDAFDGADLGDAVEPGEQDLLAATQGQSRRVRPEFVNYAKRAKRVDVRKLKENIWKGLAIEEIKLKEEDAMDMDEEREEEAPEPREFVSVISGLQKSYPKEKMDEISTSFCFICLLHLANEQGLTLETGSKEDMATEESRVGNIWSVKVSRDPDATPAA